MLIVPRRIARARREKVAAKEFIVNAGEIADQEGVEIVGIQEGLMLMENVKFREALQLAQRYEGHEKAVSQLHREQAMPETQDTKILKHEDKLSKVITKKGA